jgi:hypothetical protein
VLPHRVGDGRSDVVDQCHELRIRLVAGRGWGFGPALRAAEA